MIRGILDIPADPRVALACKVNGGLVLGIPFSMLALSDILAIVAWPTEIAAYKPAFLAIVIESVWYTLLFAALAAITTRRTRVHAEKYLAGTSRGWGGVADAAGCGFGMTLVYLAAGILTRTSEALPYILFYGFFGTILGAIVGVVLRMTAIAALKYSPEKTA